MLLSAARAVTTVNKPGHRVFSRVKSSIENVRATFVKPITEEKRDSLAVTRC